MTFKSPFAAATISTHHEPVATDLIFGDTLGVDCGYKRAKIVVGRNPLVIDFFCVKSDKALVNKLWDVIRRGEPCTLIRDSSAVEIATK